EALDSLGVTRLAQAFQERNVRLAEFQPISHRTVVAAREWLALVRITETERSIHCHDARQAQYFTNALDELRVHHSVGTALVALDHGFAHYAIVVVVKQHNFLAVLCFG